MAGKSSALKKYLSYFYYALRTFLLRQDSPYLFVLTINDQCNLNCPYCVNKNSGKFDLSYKGAITHLENAYFRGHRTLVITGGEPMLFLDGQKGISTVVEKARNIGFHEVAVFTNGTQPLKASADRYFVSIDGTREIHNIIRDNTYDLILDNVKNADANVIASVTITKDNVKDLQSTLSSIAETSLFKSITFNFLTHFPAIVDKFGLTDSEKKHALDLLYSAKKTDIPVYLSKATYNALYNNSWKRPIRQIELAAGDQIFTCCKDVNNPEVCMKCGYSSCVELSQVLAFKPSAIYELFKTL